MELLTIAAIVIGPVIGPFLGIWAHGKVEDRKSTYQRKLDIFKILMATRATPLARAHVEALNRIDIEFTETKDKKIREAWAVLLEHYREHPKKPNNLPIPDDQAAKEKYDTEFQTYLYAYDRWNEKTKDLRATLLKEMGNILRYDFDELKIKNAVYYPKLHGDVDEQQILLLEAANDVLRANRPLAMYVVNWPEQTGADA